MKWYVKTDDLNAEPLLNKFAEDFNTEWEKQTKENPMLKNFMFHLEMTVLKDVTENVEGMKLNGFEILLPLKVPTLIRMLMSGYKKKTIKQIEGLLKQENIHYASVKYLGD